MALQENKSRDISFFKKLKFRPPPRWKKPKTITLTIKFAPPFMNKILFQARLNGFIKKKMKKYPFILGI